MTTNWLFWQLEIGLTSRTGINEETAAASLSCPTERSLRNEAIATVAMIRQQQFTANPDKADAALTKSWAMSHNLNKMLYV